MLKKITTLLIATLMFIPSSSFAIDLSDSDMDFLVESIVIAPAPAGGGYETITVYGKGGDKKETFENLGAKFIDCTDENLSEADKKACEQAKEASGDLPYPQHA